MAQHATKSEHHSASECRIVVDTDAIAQRVAEILAVRINGLGPGVSKRLLTVNEAAVYLGRSKSSIQHLIADGTLPAVRHDKRVFLDVQDLEGWIEAGKA